MEKSAEQVEKNVSASFGYVKKDILMLNDAVSDLHDKIQHLSLNHAGLLEEIGRLRKELKKEDKKITKVAKSSKVAKSKSVKKSSKPKSKKVSKKESPKKVIKTEEYVY